MDEAWLGFGRLGWSAATGAVLELGGRRFLCLPGQGLLQQFAAEGIAEEGHEVFELGKGRSPRWAIGSVEVMEQVFGGGVQDRPEGVRNFYGRSLFCHLEVLSAVA